MLVDKFEPLLSFIEIPVLFLFLIPNAVETNTIPGAKSHSFLITPGAERPAGIAPILLPGLPVGAPVDNMKVGIHRVEYL